MTGGLSAEQLATLQRDGCLVIPGELSPEQVQVLLQRSKQLIEGLDLANHPLTRFATGGDDGSQHVGDTYFLESSDKVRLFFEEGVFDADGKLSRPVNKAINKIGHGLHMHEPAFAAVSLNARNAEIARQFGHAEPRLLQSMVICKQPEVGGAVPSHQDGTFLYTEPQSAIGFWYALENCTQENGALEYVPGSHVNKVYKRFVRSNPGTTFEPVPGTQPYEEPGDDKYVLVDCPAGSLVLIHNSVLHRSRRNDSAKSRFAYTFHVIDGSANYDEKNWLQIPSTGGTNFSKLEAIAVKPSQVQV